MKWAVCATRDLTSPCPLQEQLQRLPAAGRNIRNVEFRPSYSLTYRCKTSTNPSSVQRDIGVTVGVRPRRSCLQVSTRVEPEPEALTNVDCVPIPRSTVFRSCVHYDYLFDMGVADGNDLHSRMWRVFKKSSYYTFRTHAIP